MPPSPPKPLVEMSGLIVGYAMSRLNKAYLAARGFKTWTAAFKEASRLLKVKSTSVKNWRDEFDPFHDNGRVGWTTDIHDIRPSRQRVLDDFREVTDVDLLNLVDSILRKDSDAITELVEPLSVEPERIANVAERLRTGRLAELFFREHCQQITGLPAASLLDHRELFRGYDFAVTDRPELAVEVKGLKRARGHVLFTDREWTEAKARRQNYWLVVVGNLETEPAARLVPDPTESLDAKCQYQPTIAASWRATVTVI